MYVCNFLKVANIIRQVVRVHADLEITGFRSAQIPSCIGFEKDSDMISLPPEEPQTLLHGNQSSNQPQSADLAMKTSPLQPDGNLTSSVKPLQKPTESQVEQLNLERLQAHLKWLEEIQIPNLRNTIKKLESARKDHTQLNISGGVSEERVAEMKKELQIWKVRLAEAKEKHKTYNKN